MVSVSSSPLPPNCVTDKCIEAVRDIAADEDLFTIPCKSVISLATSDLNHRVDLKHSDHERIVDNPFHVLNLVLVYESLLGDKSRWKAYLDLLPNSFDTLMFWNEAELKQLQGSGVVQKIGKKDADAAFEELLMPFVRRYVDVFQGSASWSDEQLMALFHRIGSVIMAYAFDVEEEDSINDDNGHFEFVDEPEPFKGMVPLADMLNADAEPNVSYQKLYRRDRTHQNPRRACSKKGTPSR